ncbi:MAG: hypothetical protein QM723_01305 [Myxococcaceae bacterium]
MADDKRLFETPGTKEYVLHNAFADMFTKAKDLMDRFTEFDIDNPEASADWPVVNGIMQVMERIEDLQWALEDRESHLKVVK